MEQMRESKKFLCNNFHILVADPEAESRQEMCRMFAGYGVFTDEADSIQAAVKLAAEHVYDMILWMPGCHMQGERSAAQCLGEDAGRRPVMMLGAKDAAAQEECQEKGFASALLVPPEAGALEAFLTKWVPEDKKRYLDEEEKQGTENADIARIFMAGVDVISAVEQNGGLENYLDLLDIFYTDGLTREGSLKTKIETGDLLNYTIEVHGLKSAAANIGAGELSALAKQQEAYGNAQDTEAIEREKGALFLAYQGVLAEIERVLKQIAYGKFARKQEAVGGELLERESLVASVQEILGHLEDFRSREAGKGVEELLSCALSEEVRGALEQIRELLKMYEDDEAEEKLRELLQTL